MPTRDAPSAETQRALRDNMGGWIGPVVKLVDELRWHNYSIRDEGELVKVLTIGGHFFAHRPDVLLHPILTYPFYASLPGVPATAFRDALIEECDKLRVLVLKLTEDFVFS